MCREVVCEVEGRDGAQHMIVVGSCVEAGSLVVICLSLSFAARDDGGKEQSRPAQNFGRHTLFSIGREGVE